MAAEKDPDPADAWCSGHLPPPRLPGASDEWARWDASIDSLLALSNEDVLALLDHFSDPAAFLAEHFSLPELRRMAFERWRRAGQDLSKRKEHHVP